MSFQLIDLPKSVTLDDLERRNANYLRYFTQLPNSVDSGVHCVKSLKMYVNFLLLQRKCSPKHLVSSSISLTMI